MIEFDEEELLQIDFTDKSLQLIAHLNGDETANKLLTSTVYITLPFQDMV